ncbi:MAG TPA: hypothetical protein VKY53_09570 [Marinobacter sp.]|nr:hypothetical protein [Marinobacter sp.]
MYRERLVATDVHTANAHNLKRRLLEYHDFRKLTQTSSLLDEVRQLADWQASRLKATHQDLYRHPALHAGLEFLLTDLYAPAGMTRRDDNIDRIFPRMVAWLPDRLLGTFAGLVELNLITQRLDLELARWFVSHNLDTGQITVENWCEGYRASSPPGARNRQLELVDTTGRQLDRYVRNRTLGWLLSMTRSPADLAELGDLHRFIHRGYSAFRKMDKVETLIDRLIRRERLVMNNILAGHPEPFTLPGDF